MFKVAHISDQHFEKDKLEKCQASADFIVGKMREIKPDIIVSSGDIFNRLQSLNSKSAVTAAKKYIMELATIAPVAMVKGNEAHDSAGCLEVFRDLETEYDLLVTEACGSWGWDGGMFFPLNDVVRPGTAKVVLHLMSYPEKAWFLKDKPGLSIDESNLLIQDELRKLFAGFGAISADATCPVIFVGHCNMQGSILSSGQSLIGQDILISPRDMELTGADYYALGHIHKAQEIRPKMWYSGSMYHCNFGETEAKQFNLVVISKGEYTSVDHLLIPSRPLSLHECEITTGPSINDIELYSNDWVNAELRVRAHMTKECSSLVTDGEIEAVYPGAFSYQIERIIQPDERIRSSQIAKAVTLREKFVQWTASIEKETTPELLDKADELEGSVTL